MCKQQKEAFGLAHRRLAQGVDPGQSAMTGDGLVVLTEHGLAALQPKTDVVR